MADVVLSSDPLPLPSGAQTVSALELGGLSLFLYGILLTAQYNYLLFHCTAELFSIFIAVTIFLLAVNLWRGITNQYFLFVGIAYGFVALLDTLHTLSYKGMAIFTGYDYFAPQLWLASRYLESISMIIAFQFLGRNRNVNVPWLLGGFTAVTAGAVLSVFYFRTFPVCFVPGQGLTPFKVVSEYVICGFFAVSLALLRRNRRFFAPHVFWLLAWSLVAMIAMELCFTRYASDTMSDFSNQVGHLLKIIAFYLVYKAVVVTGLHDPIQLLTREVDAGKRELEAKRLLGAVIENIPLTIFVKRAFDLRFELVNRAGENLLGLGRDQLIDRNNLEVFSKAQAEAFTEQDRFVLARQECLDIPEQVIDTPQGPRILHTRKLALLDEGGRPHLLLGISEDITERKRGEGETAKLQAQLSQAHKMESLGTLAGGVAHDMNNVLGAILALASAHLAQEGLDHPDRPAFETIRDAATRGGDMVRRLLAFARQHPVAMRELDLNALLLEEARLLERTTLARVFLDLDLAPELRRIRGDGSALANVLMNICVNAVDAMGEGGTITFRTRNVGEAQVEVVIQDTGRGMTADVLAKAMDPFFTTKEVGKGTGLGLSMAFTVVQAHGGQLQLESEPGQGTRVRLRFPATLTPAPDPEPTLQDALPLGEAGLKVLLVDDDDLIQRSTGMLVEALGHTITTASSGEEALDLLGQGFQTDVVILDMNMPGLGGKGTLPRLRRLRPGVPIFLATGRVDQDALDLVAHHPHVTLLPKPFTFEELQGLLQKACGHRTAPA